MTRDETPRATSITVVFDNYLHDKSMTTDWGFASVVRGLEKTILFDTGGDGHTLLANMSALRIDPKSIDVVFLSHIDADHTGGLQDFLTQNPHVLVYLPASFPMGFKAEVARTGADIVEISQAMRLFDDVFTTGELAGPKTEQSLVVKTPDLTAVVSGCAHPGIDTMVGIAREVSVAERFLIVGGFHFFRSSAETIHESIVRLKRLGVEWAGPTHCSGDQARLLFKEAFGESYIETGAGKTIDLSKLK